MRFSNNIASTQDKLNLDFSEEHLTNSPKTKNKQLFHLSKCLSKASLALPWVFFFFFKYAAHNETEGLPEIDM